ncbi:recombinase family protein [Georgenia halophila]|uniref:Recombinase family protein n=2 Tax=Georgenia halophila TaxID=620889 RepID=A0ABP8KV56_9MICO
MMRDVAEGHLDAVVVWDVDRLTRTPRELEDVIDHADRAGLRLASVGGDIDLATEQGRMLARMKGTVARYEVEQSARRLRRKHAELAAQGAHNGRRPFGWDLAPTGLTINQAEAAVVRECVSRVLAGEGLWRIRNDLTSRGVTTTTGGPWQTQTLRRMLLRWRNCGVRTHNGTPVATGQWKPIIDRETHDRVVATLTDPARRSNNRGTAIKYLLTSIAACGECARPMVGVAEHTYKIRVRRASGPGIQTRTYPRSYKCPHAGCMRVSRGMDDIDDLVTRVAIGVLERDGVRVLGGDPDIAAAARERIDALQAKLALAADQYADDIITGEQMARITDRVRPQITAEHARLRTALPAEGLAAFAGPGAADAWDSADVETRRRILTALGIELRVDRVGPGRGGVFDPESVQITWGR